MIDAEERLELLAKRSDGALAAGEQQLVFDDAAGLNESRRLDIGVIEQHRRRDLHEPPTLVRPELQRLRNAQVQLPDLELVTDVCTESREQTRLCPNLTSHGHTLSAARRTRKRIGDTHLATQRVVLRHATHVGERAGVARQDHASKVDNLSRGELARECSSLELRIDRCVRLDLEIRCQCLTGLLRYGLTDAIREKSNGTHGRYRDEQRDE